MNTNKINPKAIEMLQKASNECSVTYVMGASYKLSVKSINELPIEENYQVVLCNSDEIDKLKNAYKDIIINAGSSNIVGNSIQFVGVNNLNNS